MAKKKKASKKSHVETVPVEMVQLEERLEAALEHITKQDTMISELQLERNEAKAAYAKLKQEVERAYNECFIDGKARLVASSTPSINLDSIKASFRDILKEKTAWERKAKDQAVELVHLRQSVKAAGVLADVLLNADAEITKLKKCGVGA